MKFQSKSTNPIFIVGAPRSGTTLLTSFVASHKNIYSGAETQFFNKIGLQSCQIPIFFLTNTSMETFHQDPFFLKAQYRNDQQYFFFNFISYN